MSFSFLFLSYGSTPILSNPDMTLLHYFTKGTNLCKGCGTKSTQNKCELTLIYNKNRIHGSIEYVALEDYAKHVSRQYWRFPTQPCSGRYARIKIGNNSGNPLFLIHPNFKVWSTLPGLGGVFTSIK